MNGTTIRKCSCVSTFQDEKYGQNMRIMNAHTSGYRCTVCGANVSSTGVPTPKKKK